MKPLIFICLILLAPAGFAQTRKSTEPPCQQTIDDVSLIRGLRLGQSYSRLNDVLPRLYGVDLKPDELGFRRIYISPSSLNDPELLKGIRFLSLIYFDDSLINIDITYDDSVKWQSNLHFVAALAQQLNLPRQGWRHKDPSYLRCSGFIVVVSSGSFMPSLKVWDLRFADTAIKRQADTEERKRARFKP